MVRKKNTRLTLKERVQIETLLNENKTNAYIAKTLKRSHEIDENKLLHIQEKLNNRPQKIIGYKTPKEIMDFELKSVA